MSERFGRLAGDWAKKEKSKVRIWIHAASVGECLAVLPLVERWLRDRPAWEPVFSVMTETGRRLVEQRLGGRVRIFFFPLDWPGIPARILRRLAPDLILLVETELWPNFLRSAARCDVPVLLINGRISPRSYRRYRMVRWMIREALRTIQVFGMQTAQDARRIIDLGAPPERVRVLGNLKFDQPVVPLSEAERRCLLNALGWKPDEKIIVAGSTHGREEEILLAVYERVKEQIPDLRLVLAPRHLNRLPVLVAWLNKRGKSFRRYSELDSARPEPDREILLVDTMGTLGSLYGLATVVFVGGSLVPVGGHNLLEPAALGRPVLFGPFVQQVSEMAELLMASGGGLRVHDRDDLIRQLQELLIRPDQRRMMEQQAQETVRRHQGASRKAFRIVERLLERRSFDRFRRLDFRTAPERWFKDRLLLSRGGIATSLAAAVLRGGALAYQGWQSVRASAYSRGLFRSVRLSRPVISIGNLTLGGTGKTPTVMAVCRLLLKKGHRPVVLSRGYGGRSEKAIRVVSDPTDGRRRPDDVGDEPCLIADRLPEVPVLVSSDRALAGRYALETFQASVLLLDDGYQHLRLQRDLNLLLVDAVCPFGNGFVFPRGILREPLRQLKRADAVLLTHVGEPAETEELQKIIRGYRPGLPIFTSRHRIVDLTHLGTGRSFPPETIRRDRLMAVTGIGQPDRFFHMLQELGSEIAVGCVYPDHYRYTEKDIESLGSEAGRLDVRTIVTTEKDAVRIRALGRPPESWWEVRMELVIDHPEAFESMVCGVLP
ncbi:MAG: tetraacyldisaccharide 4'-kinase [Nitrospirae bacterium]|nr:tetraacyldisaccharide 4'-kinase [Nitrospirota bacterium]